jgi:hypothetical protein
MVVEKAWHTGACGGYRGEWPVVRLSGAVPVWGTSRLGQGTVSFPLSERGGGAATVQANGAVRCSKGQAVGRRDAKSHAWTGDRGEGQPRHGWAGISPTQPTAGARGMQHDRLGKDSGRPMFGGPAWVHRCGLA